MTIRRASIGIMIMMITFALGMIRISVSPMWVNYDEYSHYFYMRYISVYGELPQPTSDVDADSIERVESTIHLPDGVTLKWGDCDKYLVEPDAEVRCLASGEDMYQFSQQPPGYYVLQAGINWLLQPLTVQQELFVGRLVSVLLYCLFIAISFRCVQLLFPDHYLLAVGTALLLVLTITLNSLMSALSNDVGAILIITLLFIVIVHMFRYGLKVSNVFLLIFVLFISLYIKASTWISFPIVLCAAIVAIGSRLSIRMRWLLVIILIMIPLGLIGSGLIVEPQLAAHWLRNNMPYSINRVVTDQDGNRDTLLQVSGDLVESPFDSMINEAALQPNFFNLWEEPYLYQIFDGERLQQLQGRDVTVGFWVRSPDQPTDVFAPVIWDGGRGVNRTLKLYVDEEWQFVFYHTRVPDDVTKLALVLFGTADDRIQYDDVIIVPGYVAVSDAPEILAEDASEGIWAGENFTNLVKNPGADTRWLMFDLYLNQLLPGGVLNAELEHYYELRRSWEHYLTAFRWFFVSYWGAYGSGSTALPRLPLLPFLGLMILACLGLIKGIRNMDLENWQRLVLLVFVIAVAGSFAQHWIWVRGPSFVHPKPYIPTARHFLIAVMPVSIFMVIGVSQIVPQRLHRVGLAALVSVMYVVNIWSLLNIQLPGWME